MTSGNQRRSTSRFIRIQRPNNPQSRRPDPAIVIDGERLQSVLKRLEGLSGE